MNSKVRLIVLLVVFAGLGVVAAVKFLGQSETVDPEDAPLPPPTAGLDAETLKKLEERRKAADARRAEEARKQQAAIEAIPYEKTYVVLRRARETDGSYVRGEGDPLLRELVRQQILLVVREDMGHYTRDEYLCDPIGVPSGAERVDFEATVTTTSARKALASTMSRVKDGSAHQVLEYDLPMPGTVTQDYKLVMDTVVDELVEPVAAVMREQGLGQRARKWDGNTPLPADIEEMLNQPTVTAQFHAVRRIHAMVDGGGGSPQLLGGLVRGYGNLSLLTERTWSTQWAVFGARSILYAQRLRKMQSTRWAEAHHGYALATTGFHGSAAGRFVTADRAAATGPSLPPVFEQARHMLKFDYDALLSAADDRRNPAHMMAALFAAVAADQDDFAPKLTIGLAAMNAVPQCQRVYEVMNYHNPIGLLHRSTVEGMTAIETDFVAGRYRPNDLPRSAAQVLDAAARGGDVLHAPVLCDRLIADGRATSGELPLSVLGLLGREMLFSQSNARLRFVRFGWAVDASGPAAELMKVNRNHPYAPLLRAYGAPWNEAVNIFASQQLRDRSLMLVFLDDLAAKLGSDSLRIDGDTWATVRHNAWEHRTCNGRWTFFSFNHVGINDAVVAFALEEAPNAPITIAGLLRYTPPLDEESMQLVIDKHGHHYAVQRDLGNHFAMLGEYDRAIEWFRKADGRYIDPSPIRQIARLHALKGDMEGFYRELSRVLEVQDLGLWHEPILGILGAAQVLRGNPAQAEVLFAQAAGSWSYDTINAYAVHLDRTGQWDKANAMFQRLAERYPDPGALAWYVWCVSRDTGDIDAARRLLERTGVVRPELAFEMYPIVVGDTTFTNRTASDGLKRVALEGAGLGDAINVALLHIADAPTDGREKAFKSLDDLVATGPPPAGADWRTHAGFQLAQMIQRAAQARRDGKPVTRELLAEGEADRISPESLNLHMAVIFEALGRPDDAVPCYRRAVGSVSMLPSRNAFAVMRLRELEPNVSLKSTLATSYKPLAQRMVDTFVREGTEKWDKRRRRYDAYKARMDQKRAAQAEAAAAREQNAAP